MAQIQDAACCQDRAIRIGRVSCARRALVASVHRNAAQVHSSVPCLKSGARRVGHDHEFEVMSHVSHVSEAKRAYSLSVTLCTLLTGLHRLVLAYAPEQAKQRGGEAERTCTQAHATQALEKVASGSHPHSARRDEAASRQVPRARAHV